MSRPSLVAGAYVADRAGTHSRDVHAWWRYAVAVALVLLTRVPLWGTFTGEPDTARYVCGLRFWIRHGPEAPSIINRELSSGYYWVAERLVWLTDAPFTEFPRLLGAISLAPRSSRRRRSTTWARSSCPAPLRWRPRRSCCWARAGSGQACRRTRRD